MKQMTLNGDDALESCSPKRKEFLRKVTKHNENVAQIKISHNGMEKESGVWIKVIDNVIHYGEGKTANSIKEMTDEIQNRNPDIKMKWLIRLDNDSNSTVTKEDVDYLWSLPRYGCIYKWFNFDKAVVLEDRYKERLITLEDLYEEFEVCRNCHKGWEHNYNGGNFGHFNGCKVCALKFFKEKGYFEGVDYNPETNVFSFFSETTGKEEIDLNKIKIKEVFNSLIGDDIFPYSFNFEEIEHAENESGFNCYGCDEKTKSFLIDMGWKWKEE